MKTRCTQILGIVLLLAGRLGAAEPPAAVAFREEPGKLIVLVDQQPVADYVYADEEITRPYFAHLRAPGGTQVTRNHPPVPGKDSVDHATYHPGIWMAFGDLGGNDYWRLKARVRHDRFVERPKGGPRAGRFAVLNSYLATGSQQRVTCQETCRLTFFVTPFGYLIVWDSTFSSDHAWFFGDQEEMGLGVRLATPLAVNSGGRMLDSEGRVNEKQIWGKNADWCDYSGTIDARPLGILLMPHPDNFRPCWFHARDYGLLAANPFGRQAFTRGEPSRVTVEAGKDFRLRYGVLLHAALPEGDDALQAAYRHYLKLAGK